MFVQWLSRQKSIMSKLHPTARPTAFQSIPMRFRETL